MNLIKNKKTRDPAFKKFTLFPRNRSGSHVGMIISFVIFITFIVFLYTVIKPAFNTGEDKKTILDDITNTIINNVSSNLTVVTLQLDSSNDHSKNCMRVQNFFDFINNYSTLIPSPYFARVQDETGTLLSAAVVNSGNIITILDNPSYSPDNKDLEIVRTSSTSVNNNGVLTNLFFKVYASTQFSALPTQAVSPCPVSTNYNIGSVLITKYVFQKSVLSLINNYNNDYGNLKTELNIPPGNEFDFSFEDVKGITTSTTGQKPPESTNVYSSQIPIQYVDDNADIQTGFINIKVW